MTKRSDEDLDPAAPLHEPRPQGRDLRDLAEIGIGVLVVVVVLAVLWLLGPAIALLLFGS